jgi:hypothetical protein
VLDEGRVKDRVGEVWEYSAAGVFLVVGSPILRFDEWIDHPIVWIYDRFETIRAGREDGFIEYATEPWELRNNFKRIG